MKLWALSDFHLNHRANREALAAIGHYPDDWLLVPGDVSERLDDIDFAWRTLNERFKVVIWTPGNHELWTTHDGDEIQRGVEKYDRIVDLCRDHGVLTPEDPYPVFSESGQSVVIAPLFLLYDYSFRPDDVRDDEVIAWAAKGGVRCSDESMLAPDPYASRIDWCRARVEATIPRLESSAANNETILVNHWPLRQDTIWIPRIPRFTPWCGTRRTEDWHLRFRAQAVVSGHLHVRSTRWIDGVRFEEVSLGYPKHWKAERGIDHYLRQILPAPPPRRIPRFYR
ncbi:MAG: metallophosphoesterase [Myxococcota bacterium]